MHSVPASEHKHEGRETRLHMQDNDFFLQNNLVLKVDNSEDEPIFKLFRTIIYFSNTRFSITFNSNLFYLVLGLDYHF